MRSLFLGGFILLGMNAFAGEVDVKVNGMVCSMCAQGIEKKFKNVDSVKKIEVNLNDKYVKIQTHEGQDIPDTQITKLITEAGYSVSEIKRK